MTDPVELRPACRADAPCLGVLGTQVFLDTYAIDGIRPAIANEVLRSFSTAAMERLLGRPDVRVWLAASGRHVVGFAQVTVDVDQPLVKTGRPAELDRLYVLERFTGAGLGTRLLRAAEAGGAERGATGLWLTSWVHNRRALDFYARQGYSDLGMAAFDMDDGPHENRVLFKALETPVKPT